jgi:protein SCO1/2
MKDVRAFGCVAALVASLCLLPAIPARAQNQQGLPAAGAHKSGGIPAGQMPKVLREIGFDQNLGDRIPLDIPFKDETGRDVRIGDYFGQRPVVLALVYYECPMLCTLTLKGLTSALGVLTLDPGRDFEVVVVSFSPAETPMMAAAKKASFLERYDRPATAGGWHFLTGQEVNIRRLTNAVGFRYVFDRSINQYAHPTGITVLTPEGRLARYLFGVEYGPRDLRLALVEASGGKVGNAVDSVMLYCYHYDESTGKYGVQIMTLIRTAGAGTVLALAAFIVVMLRRDRKTGPRPGGPEVN